MSVQSAQSSIERTQREISNLQQKLTDEARNEASKTERIYQTRRSITQHTSPSSVQSKLRDIEYAERDIVSIQKKKADLTKQVADKTSQLHKYQQELFREQAGEQKKMLDSMRRRKDESNRMRDSWLSQVRLTTRDTNSNFSSSLQPSNEKYDAFISHASEDKETLVRPLAEKLTEVDG